LLVFADRLPSGILTAALASRARTKISVREINSLSGCEHRIYLRPMQNHLNRGCTECIRQIGRFCLNVCDVFWVRQQIRIQRFSGYSDLGPDRTKAILIGVSDLLSLSLFIIRQLGPSSKAADEYQVTLLWHVFAAPGVNGFITLQMAGWLSGISGRGSPTSRRCRNSATVCLPCSVADLFMRTIRKARLTTTH